MKFPPSLLDEIRARLPVSAVVGRRVKLRKQGREWRGLSPFQAEKTPSFYVNDQKGFYHCFSSGQHGDIFRFLMETEGLPFPEAVERLAGEAGVELPKVTSEDLRREEARASLHEVLALAAKFFEGRLHAREGAAARGYLADRGLTPAIQAEFGLGFAPNEKFALRDHLAGKGVGRDAMIEAGLLIHGEDIQVPYDRFRERVMFPIHDARGRVIAFGGRAMARDAQAKYLNSPETTLFHKGSCLYNHHRAREAAHRTGSVIAVEGYVDVIMMSVAGFAHTVAPLGTALTEDQLGLLWRMSEEPTLCFDGDKAGRRAAYRALDVALPHVGVGKALTVALLPEGQDPDELVRSAGAGAVADVLRAARPLSDILWMRETEGGDFATPEKRAALERRLMEAVAPIQDETVRRHYQADMQARLRAFFGPPARAFPARGGEARGRPRPRDGRPAPAPPIASLVTPGVRDGALARGSRAGLPGREALILAVVVGHPALLERHCEALAEVEFDNPDADRLRRALVDCAAEGSRDSAALVARLEGAGFSRLLQRLAADMHWWTRPDAAESDVERGFAHVLTLHRGMRTLHRELKLATAALERDFTDENFARLSDIKAQIALIEGTEATIDGFGASSGRSAR
ncbi:DNA primase [Labrys wisconsinensis]|uniref:DNA primase n=1 Tax=Labrys wisconsinensis TaxID=425677 RepID=A0ABU0JIF0_9HYPH|nr:DNA primase [Labrys wisconsinensis]MDQ0472922.1 DNA primase [Labrys wisconsinensis]